MNYLRVLQQNIFIVVVLLCLRAKCPPSIEPEMEQKIELQYQMFLFDEKLSDVDRDKSAINFGALQFHSAIYNKFKRLLDQLTELEMAKKRAKEIHDEYDVIMRKILSKKEKNGLKLLCKMWEMDKYLDVLITKPSLLENSINFMSADNCEKLEKIGWTEKHKWPPGFESDLSRKHLEFFEQALSMATRGDGFSLKQWFSDQNIQGEGNLIHLLRTSKLKSNNLSELNEAKRKMLRHLLTHGDLELLECKYPLIMSIDAIDGERLKLFYEKMFDFNQNSMQFSKKIFHLKFAFMFSKIFAYFWEYKQNETSPPGTRPRRLEERFEKLWKLFGGILSNVSENCWDQKTGEFQTNSLKALDNLLKYLQKEFGQIGQDAQMNVKHLLVKSFNQLLRLCDNSAEYLQNFRTMSENRIILKQTFEHAAEGMAKVVSDQLWDWLDDADKNMLQENINDDQNSEEPFHKGASEASEVQKAYTECPEANLMFTELLRADKNARNDDPEAFALMTLYIELLQGWIDGDKNAPFMLKVKLEAAIWYYKEFIRELFRFGHSLDDKTEIFVQNLNTISKFEQEITEIKEGSSKELCKVYKIAHKITKMTELADGSEKWRNRIEKMTRPDNFNMFEENLIILPNGNESAPIIRWGDIECQNGEIVKKLVTKLLEAPRTKRIHLFCLDKLIKRFKIIQSFFCHGDDQFVPVELKENIRFLLSERAMDTLETRNPQILHFELPNLGMFSATFLSLMSRKSGTTSADNYEARLYLPFLIQKINNFEEKLEKDHTDLTMSTRKALLMKIVKTKNEFYALMDAGYINHMRQSHCKLFQFAKFVEKSIELGREEASIEGWEPTECQNENVIKETLLAHRKTKKRAIYESLRQALKLDIVVASYRACRGCYTRMDRYFDDDKLFEKLTKEVDILDFKVFEDDRLLQLHYIDVLLLSDLTTNIEGWMKADLFLFIRWMNTKEFGKECANERMAKRIGRVWDNSFCTIFTRSYDRLHDYQAPVHQSLSDEVQNVRKICSNVKNYAEKAVNSKKAKTDDVIFAEWTKVLTKSLSKSLVLYVVKDIIEPSFALETEADQKALQQFNEWAQHLHFETLKRLLRDDSHFAALFKSACTSNAICNSNAFIDRLANLLNNKQNVESILSLLGAVRSEQQHISPIKETTVSSPTVDTGSLPSLDSPIMPGSPNVGSPSGSTSTVDSPTVRSPSVEKKKAKRKKAKRSKNRNEFVLSPSIAEHETDDISSGTPEKWRGQNPSEQNVQIDEKEGEALLFAAEELDEFTSKQTLTLDKQAVTEQTSPISPAIHIDEKEEAENKSPNNEKKQFLVSSAIHIDEKEKAENEGPNNEEKQFDAADSTEYLGKELTPAAKSATNPEETNQKFNAEIFEANFFEFEHESKTENLDNAEFENIKIGDFTDVKVLMMKYADLFWHLFTEQAATDRKFKISKFVNEKEAATEKQIWKQKMPKFGEQNASVSAIVHLLDVGIYANKIGHQLKAIHQIEGIWSEIGIQQSDLVNIERKWAQLKELKLSSKIRWAHLEGFLHELLKQLLALLDQKNAIDSPRHGSSSSNSSSSSGGVNFEKEIRGLKNELHLRNLAVAVADNSSDCSLLFWTAFGAEKPKNNSTPLLSLLLFSDSDSIKTHLSQYVKMVKKENSQRKIDNQLYSQYRNNKNFSKFVVPKMATNFVPSQLEQISEFWQPINFGEDRFKQSDIDNLAKEVFKANKYLIFDITQRQQVENAIEQLKELFKIWSSKVNCHISDKCLLRPTGEPTMLETVCIMPQQFDVSLSFFGGSFNCDFDNREMCQDQSLYCKLCNNANVLSLTKINKDQFTPVPQLQFTFKNCQFTILAIIVPSLEGDHHRRKTEPFDGQQIDKISQKFGDEIEKLIRADHLFDEGQFRSSQKVNSDTIELLTNSLIHAEPREIPKIMEQIFMFDEFDEMLVKGRQIAIRQRASVTDLLATLKVFANFGNDLKIAEFIADTAAFGQTRYESNNSMNKFCLTLAYLELWANSNHLDDAKLGYLDFNILTIMVTKIFLLYPNATVPWLIEKFFITYSTWKWPLPIQLAEIDFDRKGEFLSWTPGREWFTKRQFSPKTLLKTIRAEMAMAIITPTFPEHNLAQNANLSSIKCIQNQMAKALAKIRNENVQNALIVPLESQKFSNMYEHFIVVTCTASNYRIDNLANFVSKRLGHELAEIIENPLEKWIKFSHICSRCISLGECSEKSSPKSPATSNCKKIWLIGIELNESLKELSKFKSKLRANLKKKFDEKIKSDFDGGFVEIESEYVDERETLQKFWGIDLNLI